MKGPTGDRPAGVGPPSLSRECPIMRALHGHAELFRIGTLSCNEVLPPKITGGLVQKPRMNRTTRSLDSPLALGAVGLQFDVQRTGRWQNLNMLPRVGTVALGELRRTHRGGR